MISISDLTQQLNIKENELLELISELGFVANKNNKISNKKAEEIINANNVKKSTKVPSSAKDMVDKLEGKQKEKDVNVSDQEVDSEQIKETEKEKQELIEISSIISVKEFADILKVSVSDIITVLMKNGVLVTINEEIDFETAAIVALELGFDNVKEIKTEDKKIKEKIDFRLQSVLQKENKKDLKIRPPVVTIMGHVDHGKTSLLDTILKSSIIDSEAGGITQHIGAYQVEVNLKEKKKKSSSKKRKITFLDTPGHEAFTEMRARGAHIADIIILLIDTTDGIRPQTIEVIDYIKNAKIPFIIALNKIDRPEADPDRIKQQLSDLGLVIEKWGGDVLCTPISAKKGKGIDDLLELILLVADMKEFKANPDSPALGAIIESRIDYGKGPQATILVQNGTLKQDDYIVVGKTIGKIRIMEDFLGKRIKEALPSTPTKIAGLSSIPHVGDILQVVNNEKEAKLIVSKIDHQEHIKSIKRLKKIKSDEIKETISNGQIKELKLIIKADVKGSLETICSSLTKLLTNEVIVNIISDGIGDVSESDIMMAHTSSALIIGFNVQVDRVARSKARSEKVNISTYDVIYELIDDVKKALSDLLEPEIIHIKLGRFKVMEIFLTGKNQMILGGKVTSGKIEKGAKSKVLRNSLEVCEGTVSDLRIQKKSVQEVLKGHECGIKFGGDCIIEKGDILEAYIVEERKRTL